MTTLSKVMQEERHAPYVPETHVLRYALPWWADYELSGVVLHYRHKGTDAICGAQLTLSLANGTVICTAQEDDPTAAEFHLAERIHQHFATTTGAVSARKD